MPPPLPRPLDCGNKKLFCWVIVIVMIISSIFILTIIVINC